MCPNTVPVKNSFTGTLREGQLKIFIPLLTYVQCVYVFIDCSFSNFYKGLLQ